MHRPNILVLIAAAAGLSLLTSACGGEPADDTAPETQASEDYESADTGSGRGDDYDTAVPAGDQCGAFPRDLLDKWGLQKQLVLNLALAKGRNLKTMRETMGAPEPSTFRTLANAFENSGFANVERMENFDTPDVIAVDLRRTADLLEAALAAGNNPANPAWVALSEFYTQKFFIRHNSSISYYLREADCV